MVQNQHLAALDSLANVPPTLKVLMCRNRYLSDAEWAMMPAEVQLDELVTFELTAAALDHLSEAMYTDAGHITVEASAHLPQQGSPSALPIHCPSPQRHGHDAVLHA